MTTEQRKSSGRVREALNTFVKVCKSVPAVMAASAALAGGAVWLLGLRFQTNEAAAAAEARVLQMAQAAAAISDTDLANKIEVIETRESERASAIEMRLQGIETTMKADRDDTRAILKAVIEIRNR